MNDACVGDYGVQAELPGFETGVRRGIKLTVGREAVVNFRLSVGEVTQSIEVTGEAPMIQIGTSEIGGIVDGKTMSKLSTMQGFIESEGEESLNQKGN